MIGYRPQAKRDIADIAFWYEEQAASLSEKFMDAVEATLAQLERYPQSGTQRVFLHPELQELRWFPVTRPFDASLLFYIPMQDGIELIRVLHSKRDIAAILAL